MNASGLLTAILSSDGNTKILRISGVNSPGLKSPRVRLRAGYRRHATSIRGLGAGAAVSASKACRASFSAMVAGIGLPSSQNEPTASAESLRSRTPLGAGAAAVYEQFVENAVPGVDFSGIIRFLRGA
jgi:hypothetical protein